ncbi:hypothetical protein TNCV_3445001 [Trichonephila clavipes]|nr:hypothetical protein TNCV_3445001 [Trichonephila clavipes]
MNSNHSRSPFSRKKGKPAVGDTWDKSGKPYGQIREGHAFQMPTMHSGHSRLIISVSVKFQSTPRAFPTNPDMVGRAIQTCLSLIFTKGVPLKVDASIFCYGFELIDYSIAHEVIHMSLVMRVLNGAPAICKDSNVARVSSVEDGL